MNNFLRVLSISIALLTVSVSQVSAQSCSDIFSGGLDTTKPLLLPGAPAQLQVKAEGGDINVFRGDELLSTVRREDSAALSAFVYDTLGKATLPGQGVRIGFEGMTTADAAQLMRNLSFEGEKRQYGIQEGVIAAGGAGGIEPPAGTERSASGEATPPNGQRGGVRKLLGKDPTRRYDFTKAEVTYAKDSVSPIAYEGSGARFIQDFVVDVPSTPSRFDFVVRVLYGSKKAIEIETSALDVITEALHQTKLNNATLRQAANEIIKEIREVDNEWNAAIEGADKILVELIFVPVPVKIV